MLHPSIPLRHRLRHVITRLRSNRNTQQLPFRHLSTTTRPIPHHGVAWKYYALATSPLLLYLTYRLSNSSTIECSPKLNGTPIAATFLMRQAEPIFRQHFSGLEFAPIYVVDHPDFGYSETGAFRLFFPTGCECEVPVFQKLSDKEEFELGQAGVRKTPIGTLVMRGECKYGCAQVLLVEMTVIRGDGEVVWSWKRESC